MVASPEIAALEERRALLRGMLKVAKTCASRPPDERCAVLHLWALDVYDAAEPGSIAHDFAAGAIAALHAALWPTDAGLLEMMEQ